MPIPGICILLPGAICKAAREEGKFVDFCGLVVSISKMRMADGGDHMSIWIEYDYVVYSAESHSVTKRTDVSE